MIASMTLHISTYIVAQEHHEWLKNSIYRTQVVTVTPWELLIRAFGLSFVRLVSHMT